MLLMSIDGDALAYLRAISLIEAHPIIHTNVFFLATPHIVGLIPRSGG